MGPRARELSEEIAAAVDRWREQHPDVTVGDILTALERVRHVLTEATIIHAPSGYDWGLGRC